ALVVGMVGTLLGLVQARREAEAKERALDKAVASAEEAKKQTRQAEQERAIAQAVNDFLQNWLLRQAASDAQADRGYTAEPNLTMRVALDRAAARVGAQFRDQPLVEAAIRQALGDAYKGVGAYDKAIEQMERALELRQAKLGADHGDTLLSMHNLARAYSLAGRHGQALPLAARALEIAKAKKGADDPATLVHMLNLARAHRD